MRVSYFGSFRNSWDTESYIARAFERLGHEVDRIDESTCGPTQLIDRCVAFRPDLLLFAKGRFCSQWEPSCEHLRPVVWSIRGHIPGIRVACWVFDLLCREYNAEREQWAHEVDGIVDRFFLTDGFTERRLAKGHVLRQGIPDDIREGKIIDKWECDVLWLGGIYRSRQAEFASLRKQFGDRLRLVEEGVRGDELADLIASSKIVIGPDFPSFSGYWSNRIYIVAGHGGFYLAPGVDGMAEDGWLPGVHYVQYRTPHCATIAANWALPERHADRREIAHAAQKMAMASHTYDRRVKELVEVMESS